MEERGGGGGGDLCDCGDDGCKFCCLAYWCAPCALGSIAASLSQDMGIGRTVCCLAGCVPNTPFITAFTDRWLLGLSKRKSVSEKYGIGKSRLNGCKLFFCRSCALAQAHRDLPREVKMECDSCGASYRYQTS